MKKLTVLLGLFLCGCASLPGPRSAQNLDTGWKFIRQDVPVDAAIASWDSVTVPHTWNAFDGQDGPTPGNTRRTTDRNADYYRGPGWYARSLDIPASWQGQRIFIRFEAASSVANVYVNGQAIGEHRGSFTAFCFELTPYLKFGQPNELRVRVDNSMTQTVAPLAGDFDVDGGIYRPVHIFATNSICITPLDYATSGVYLTTQALSDKEAQVEVKTLISNGLADAAPVDVVCEIKDAQGGIVASKSTSLTLPVGNAPQTVPQTVTIASPHLWNGEKDPYLYSATVRVIRGGQTVDQVTQPLGLRTVQITEADGFLLNGQPYPIHGVDRHQDLKDHGWALSPADHERDMQMMLDMGVTAIRLAHYPQSEYFHDLADRSGMLLWNEVSFVNAVSSSPGTVESPSPDMLALEANLEQQLHELILQRYNHPACAFWGLFNELNNGATDRLALPVVQRLNALAHQLDPSRITVAASNHLNNATNFVADRQCYNVYPGWYSTFASGDIDQLIDQRYTEQKNRRIGFSEYGAGSNPAQHQEGTLTPPTANGGAQHPEEWQTYVHEHDWAQINDNPKLWGTFLWVMFDFSSDGRNEGSQPGINDKGMVTQDRQIKKDVYYFYQANWTTKPMVYIASRRAVTRTQAQTEVQVFSNCPQVELFLNGKSLGEVKPDNVQVARWAAVTLQPGKNTITAVSKMGLKYITDTCDWTLQTTPTPAAP
jgi:beta-galactosidase